MIKRTKIVISKDYNRLKTFIEALPVDFMQTGTVIYSGRNILKTFDVQGLKINVKSFKKPLLINQIMYATFRKSKAKRSFLYAEELKKRGFLTPDPVSYIEVRRNFLLKYSLYASLHVEFDGMMRELQTGKLDGREEFLRQFAQYTASLHENKILHLDYSSGNILYIKKDNNYEFYLVDLNRMAFDKPIDIDTACFNFRRLWGSDQMISFIVREYARARNFDEETCLQKTFKYREKFWERFCRQHPGSTPYIG